MSHVPYGFLAAAAARAARGRESAAVDGPPLDSEQPERTRGARDGGDDAKGDLRPGQRPGYGVADQQIDGADDGRAGDDPTVVRPEDDAGGAGRHQAHPGDYAADGDADGGFVNMSSSGGYSALH